MQHYSATTDHATLIHSLFDKQAEVQQRIHALLDLSQGQDAELAQRVLSILADTTEPPQLRGEVCDHFADQWDKRALPVLNAALQDASVEVRFWAAYAVYSAYFHIPYAAKNMLLPALSQLVASDEVLAGWWHVGREALPALESIYYAQIRRKNWLNTAINTFVISPRAEYMTFAYHPEAAPRTTDLKIAPRWLAQQLKRRWQTVKFHVRQPVVAAYRLDWQIGTGKRMVLGALHQDGFGIVLTGLDGQAITRFAAWYRTLIPLSYPLYLYDWAYTGSLIQPQRMKPPVFRKSVYTKPRYYASSTGC